jgi:hypothetical protein
LGTENINSKPEEETENFILDAFGQLTQTDTLGNKYDIDTFVVMEIAKRYHLDEMRIKFFHPEIVAMDGHKKAGYLCYWTSKLKPIKVRDYSAYDTAPQKPRYVNELFAFYLGCGKINAIGKPNDKRIDSGIITKDFVTALLHTLRFRVTTGDNLSMLFYLIDELIPLKKMYINFSGFNNLNADGKEKLKERLSELLKLSEYTEI